MTKYPIEFYGDNLPAARDCATPRRPGVWTQRAADKRTDTAEWISAINIHMITDRPGGGGCGVQKNARKPLDKAVATAFVANDTAERWDGRRGPEHAEAPEHRNELRDETSRRISTICDTTARIHLAVMAGTTLSKRRRFRASSANPSVHLPRAGALRSSGPEGEIAAGFKSTLLISSRALP